MSDGLSPVVRGPRYRAGDFVSSAAGPQHTLRQSSFNGSASLLTVEQAALLDRCARFRTLDEHAAAYADNRVIRDELEALARRGLLISEADLRERCFRAARAGVRRHRYPRLR